MSATPAFILVTDRYPSFPADGVIPVATTAAVQARFRPHRGSSAWRRWVAAWIGGALLGVINGVAREALYSRHTGDRAAHQLSTATIVALLAGYFVALDRRWPLQTRGEAASVGVAWLALTATFEFGFGHWVAGEEWSELLADYNLAEGRLWSLVLAWTAVGPLAVREVLS